MAEKIQLRRDTAAAWTLANPVLSDGEIGWERDTYQFKVGDGVTHWNDLDYGGIQGPPGASATGFNFTQLSAETTWTINHNLGFRPTVEIFTTGGEQINADVLHTSVNQSVITFVLPTAGQARCV